MLWLCLYFPRLPAEALNLNDSCAAVVAQKGSRRWLVTETAGVTAGTPLASALSLQPRLATQLRRPAAERERLRALAHALYGYGSPVCSQIFEPHNEGQLPWPLLWIEIGASLDVHDGLDSLQAALRADLIALETSAQLAIAPTRLGAALLARSGLNKPALTIEDMQVRLHRLPLNTLLWPLELLDDLRGIGIDKLGEVMALPRAEFARRFGGHWLLQLDRIRGLAPHPFQAIHLPSRFMRRFEFFQEVETVEGLLFPLRRLCMELQHYLRARDAGACSVRLSLLHAQGLRSGFTHRYTMPTRDATHLLSTLRERLQRLPSSAPVREIALYAEDFALPSSPPADLFDESMQTLEWQQMLERLRARFGDAAVWTPVLTGDHRPERAWCASGTPITEPPTELPARPAWLLRQPRPLNATPRTLTRAERIEQGWWDGSGINRDYYTAEIAGGRAWVFQNLLDGSWHLHGWWA